MTDSGRWTCALCGHTSEWVRPDLHLVRFEVEYRCPAHYQAWSTFWHLPGDHPTPSAEDAWPMECDECGTAFDVFEGFYAAHSRPEDTSSRYERRCLDCATWEWLRGVTPRIETEIEPHVAVCNRCGVLARYSSAGGAFTAVSRHVDESGCSHEQTDWIPLREFGGRVDTESPAP